MRDLAIQLIVICIHYRNRNLLDIYVFFFQAEDGIRDDLVTGVQTCALPIYKCEIAAEVGELLAEAGLYQKGLKASMVLVSDREARVGTLLTLWDADRFNPSRERLTTWTLKIVAQFADGPLPAHTSVHHIVLP